MVKPLFQCYLCKTCFTGSSETNNDDSIVEEKSPTQKRTYQYYKQINDDKNTTIGKYRKLNILIVWFQLESGH